MGTKQKPGQFDCYNNAKHDEPMFVLLGRDDSAAGLVREWAQRRAADISVGLRPQSDAMMVVEALACAIDMENYANKWRHSKSERFIATVGVRRT